jgi:hypothetical protein
MGEVRSDGDIPRCAPPISLQNESIIYRNKNHEADGPVVVNQAPCV